MVGIKKVNASRDVSFYYLVSISNHQLPANGLPKIPTANSIQTNTRITKVIPIRINFLFVVLNLSKMILMIKAVGKRINPATTKSNKDQLTSLENCIASIGIHNKTNGIENITMLLWFLVIIILNFNRKEL